ncbi:DUF3892 domain-containing protein [Qipengyuania sp. 483]
MTKTQTIRCINKDDRLSPFERIKFVGGVNPNGSRWRRSQQQIVEDIDSGSWQYYVGEGSSRVKVVTAESPYRNSYIKTEADGREPNNLLSLPECP